MPGFFTLEMLLSNAMYLVLVSMKIQWSDEIPFLHIVAFIALTVEVNANTQFSILFQVGNKYTG